MNGKAQGQTQGRSISSERIGQIRRWLSGAGVGAAREAASIPAQRAYDEENQTQRRGGGSPILKGGGVVVRHALGGSKEVRSKVSGVRSRIAGAPVASYDVGEGNVVHAQRHPTRNSYEKAVDAIMEPAAVGSMLQGNPFHEYEFQDRGSRKILVSGRDYLGAVKLTATTAVGGRMLSVPVSPPSFGGRMSHFSQTFEQYKLRRMRVIYAPTCPTSTDGAVAMYYYSDPSQSMLPVGLAELQHASTHENFVQVPVWQQAEMEVDPKSATGSLYDEQTGDARLFIQGMIIIECAASMDAGSFGNLFCEWEVEFWQEALDYDVGAVSYPLFNILGGATTAAVTEAQAILIRQSQAAGVLAISTGLTLSSAPNYVFVGTIVQIQGEFIGLTVFTERDPTRRTLTLGMGIVGIVQAIDVSGTLTYQMLLFDSMDDLDSGNLSASVFSDNSLLWGADFTFSGTTGTLSVEGRLYPVSVT